MPGIIPGDLMPDGKLIHPLLPQVLLCRLLREEGQDCEVYRETLTIPRQCTPITKEETKKLVVDTIKYHRKRRLSPSPFDTSTNASTNYNNLLAVYASARIRALFRGTMDDIKINQRLWDFVPGIIQLLSVDKLLLSLLLANYFK